MMPEIELSRGSMMPADPINSGSEMNLTDEQQSALKKLMTGCTVDQLDCICDCCRTQASKMRDYLHGNLTIEDFNKAKLEEEQSEGEM